MKTSSIRLDVTFAVEKTWLALDLHTHAYTDGRTRTRFALSSCCGAAEQLLLEVLTCLVFPFRIMRNLADIGSL